MRKLEILLIEDCVERPFRVLRATMTGVMQLGRTVYLRTRDGRVVKRDFVDKDKEGPGAAVDDSGMGAPTQGALVTPWPPSEDSVAA